MQPHHRSARLGTSRHGGRPHQPIHSRGRPEKLPETLAPRRNRDPPSRHPAQAPYPDNAGRIFSSTEANNAKFVPPPTGTKRAPAAYAWDVSRALTDMELRVSCYRNEINFRGAVRQQPDLVELELVSRQLDSIHSACNHHDEVSFLRMENNLLKQRNAVLDCLVQDWATRAVGISDVMAECGFSDRFRVKRSLMGYYRCRRGRSRSA